MRIITDDETTGAQGCDIQNLANAGIPIRNDNNLQARMHHKFIVIDDELVMNGSFNWTVSAVKYNNENVTVTTDQQMVSNFKKEFLRLWNLYEDGALSSNGVVDKELVEYQQANNHGYKSSKKNGSYSAWND